jgi:hypothetical protein
MIFFNLTANSPPLSLYPAAQRVTFLYYLGRFSFSIGHHYLRAAICLEAAYLQTLPSHVSHRTNILTYLIPCNILLGRFPSQQLLSRPEARTLVPIFQPLCMAIKTGNFALFQSHLAANESWLFDRGLLLSLTYRVRPLLWRSLSRKTFILTYVPPTDANSRRAATLDLSNLYTTAVYLQHRLEGWERSGAHNSSDSTTLVPPTGGPRKLRPNEGMVWGNADVTPADVEMMVATLIQQGLMHGFIAHGQGRFAIIGAKAKGPVLAGWGNVWQAIKERRYSEDFDPNEVPGWVRD